MKKIISFDVSKKTINVYNSIEDKSSKITNTYKDITDLVTKYQDYVFVYEATGIYSSTLLKACNDLQVKHYFIHPNDSSQLFSSLFCKSNKTDELDAKQLAQLAELLMLQESQLGKSKFIKPNSNQIAILRSYMSQIRFYKETIKLFNQRLEKLGCDAFTDSNSIKTIQSQITLFEKEIISIESEILTLFESLKLTKKYEQIKTIPSIGQTTAIELTVFFSTLSDKGIEQKDSKKMLAYSGLNPDISQSGTSINKTGISKKGDKNIRTALYMIGMQRFRRVKFTDYKNTTIGQFAVKMINKFGSSTNKRGKSVACAVSHKILDIARAIYHTEIQFSGFLKPITV